MRITFVLPEANLSGGSRVVAMHALHLARRGHRVTVVSAPPRSRTRRMPTWFGRRHRARTNASHLDGLPLDHHVIDRRRPLVDNDVPDADVIVATWWETAIWVMNLSPAKGAKLYFIQGDERTVVPHAAAAIEQTWHLPMHRITISQWLARMIADQTDDAQVDMVPNAVDPAQFHAPPHGKQPVPTVGVVHSHCHAKGCDIALDAVRLAQKRLPELKLIVFGQRRPLRGQYALPVGATFIHQPSQGSLRDLYAGCDAWLFPSRREGFGLPILEAMACRTPVIAAPAGAAPQILADGGGILLDSHQPTEMADAIVRTVRMDKAPWRVMSDAALATAGQYTWPAASGLFEAALYRAAEKQKCSTWNTFVDENHAQGDMKGTLRVTR